MKILIRLQKYCRAALIALVICMLCISASDRPRFKVFVKISKAADHKKMMSAAKPFLKRMARENGFVVDITDDNRLVNVENLSRYHVFVQLQEAPFDLTPKEQSAVQQFIEQGKGWVGIHAAGLTGTLYTNPDKPYWQWFEDAMGGVRYTPHPAFQKGTLVIEDRGHPITRNLPEKMEIYDEWYEFNKSPRPHVRVLAHADESTYRPRKPMGDHPLIWVNEKYERMVYIGIGHDAALCANPDFNVLVRDAILWAGKKSN
ncbi:ThuA domain-containing protein [Dyadobacter sp. 32]|uniref:ThuA domain-containing protein n=1 Tax=Dyadobacter sp. 32 TaxID=538966 RepID=UPI0011EDA4E6